MHVAEERESKKHEVQWRKLRKRSNFLEFFLHPTISLQLQSIVKYLFIKNKVLLLSFSHKKRDYSQTSACKMTIKILFLIEFIPSFPAVTKLTLMMSYYRYILSFVCAKIRHTWKCLWKWLNKVYREKNIMSRVRL